MMINQWWWNDENPEGFGRKEPTSCLKCRFSFTLTIIFIIISSSSSHHLWGACRCWGERRPKRVHHWQLTSSLSWNDTHPVQLMIITVTLVQPLPTFFFSIFSSCLTPTSFWRPTLLFFFSFKVFLKSSSGCSLRAALTAELHGQPWSSDTYDHDSIFREFMWANFRFYCKERGFFSPLPIWRAKRNLKKMCDM